MVVLLGGWWVASMAVGDTSSTYQSTTVRQLTETVAGDLRPDIPMQRW
jgi:hypothetical protein